MICYSGVCGDLTDPDNGCVIRTGTAPFETVIYTCNEGYTLMGDRKRECEVDVFDPEAAEWMGTKLACVKDGTEPTSECKSHI